MVVPIQVQTFDDELESMEVDENNDEHVLKDLQQQEDEAQGDPGRRAIIQTPDNKPACIDLLSGHEEIGALAENVLRQAEGPDEGLDTGASWQKEIDSPGKQKGEDQPLTSVPWKAGESKGGAKKGTAGSVLEPTTKEATTGLTKPITGT
jgi:hypothetical protein